MHKIFRIFPLFSILSALLLLPACVTTNESGAPVFEGFSGLQTALQGFGQPRLLHLSGEISLPAGAIIGEAAELEVVLNRPPQAEGEQPQQIAIQTLKPVPQAPILYQLSFQPAQIEAGEEYVILARIREEEEITHAARLRDVRPLEVGEALDLTLQIALPQSREMARRRVDEINANIDQLRRIGGRHDVGGVPTDFTAWLDAAGQPVIIREQRSTEDGGHAEAGFHYLGGRMLRYHETGERVLQRGSRAGESISFQLELFYSGATFLGGAKTVGGDGMTPTEEEIRAAYQRGQILRERILRALTSQSQSDN